MKRILLLSLLLLPIVALAQYPTFSNKQKLGVQTTGDGLIYRGSIHPNYYTPSNINNAYFYLDTTTSKLYLYNDITWQQIYPTASDTISLGAYLLKSDTSAMLLPYLRKSDTISLSNRINNKLNTTDTVSLSNRINLKLNNTDTINLSNRIDLKLNKSDTISLSNRIDIKLNASDTVSLSNRINKKLDTIYINYPTYIDTITNKDTIQIAPSLVLTEGFGINVIGDSINIDSAVILATQQKQIAYVKNQSGVTIYKGQAVYSSGSSGDNKLVTLASSATEQSSSKTFGVVESDSIPNGSHGYIITFGLLSGINTDALNEGSSVYLSSTSGQLTSVKPIAPLHLVTIGVCIRKQQNNGSIFVKIQNGFEFDELHDVRLTDLVDKSSIYYNLSEKLWRDTTAALLVSDTASMLSKYVNTYSNQTGINGDKTFNNVVTIDSATVTGKLLVNTNISDAVKISSNTNSTNLELMNSSGTVSIKSSNKNMILQTDTTALVYLNGNNKKVGILTMNPQQELEVAGNVRIDSLNNNIVPTRIVGSSNNGDLTNVNLGEGLSFINDTLKVDLTIIDTAIAASSITLFGDVSGSGSTNSSVNTTIGNGVVTNDMLAGGISDTKLNTITTAGKVDNSATTATSSPINNTIVLRNGTGDFTAKNITATNFYGLASIATLANTIQSTNTTGIIKLTTSSNSVLPIITVPDVNATMATTDLSQTFGGTQTFSNTISGSINGNAATVTSVLPSNFASQTANTVLAAPNGSSGTPTFRSLVSSDIPSLNYLPLSGGVLSGGLTSTTGTFTGLNINNTTTQGILSLQGADNNTPTRIDFKTGNEIRRQIIVPTAESNMQFRTSTIGGTQGGYSFYTRRNPNLSEFLAFNIDLDGNSNFYGTLGVSSNITANSFIKSGGLSTQFLKADGSVDANTYLTTSLAASTYLPLAGGTLTGALNGTTGTFNTRLGVGSFAGSPLLFASGTGNQEVHFAHSQNIAGATVTLRLTNTDATHYTQGAYFQGIVNRGINEMSGALGTNGSEYIRLRGVDDGGVVGVGIFNTNPSYNLDVTGTFRATSTTVLSSLGNSGNRMVVTDNNGVLSTQAIPTGTLVGTDTVSLSNRINTKVGLTGNETINGTKTFGGLIVPTNGMMLTATGNNSNKLLGLNVSSIVGEITLGSGLNLSNNVLSATTTNAEPNLYLALNGPTIVLPTSMASQSTYFLHIDNVSTVTVTLPTASLNTNKSITIKNGGSGAVNSNANNVQRLTGTTSNIILLSGGGKFATLVSDGFNWITMAAN